MNIPLVKRIIVMSIDRNGFIFQPFWGLLLALQMVSIVVMLPMEIAIIVVMLPVKMAIIVVMCAVVMMDVMDILVIVVVVMDILQVHHADRVLAKEVGFSGKCKEILMLQ